MKQCFEFKKFNTATLTRIAQINQILDDYRRQGYDLSLRQLYYQLVSKNLVENTERSYKQVGCVVSDGRLAGLIDWAMIKDRGRETTTLPHWKSPAEILRSAARGFNLDKWEDQPTYVEVMVEKQALEGVLEPVCQELDVPFSACKGYASSSFFYEAGKRLLVKALEYARAHGRSRELVVIYLGDHDPSGIDMTRDVEERLCMFSGRRVEVRRVALNMPQIEEYGPPENPAKMSDSRASSYVAQFGESSWELDALNPSTLAALVRDEVATLRDEDLWQAKEEQEEKYRSDLQAMARRYETGEEDEDEDENEDDE